MPTGNIDDFIVGVGDEATVLPTDPAAISGEVKRIFNATTVTNAKIVNELKKNPTRYGFKDSDAVQAAIDGGLDLTKYEGKYWWNNNNEDPNPAFTGLAPKLDADTVSEAEINAYLASEGFDPTTGVFDSLGFTSDTPANLTAQHRLDNEITGDEVRSEIAKELGITVASMHVDGDTSKPLLTEYQDAALTAAGFVIGKNN